MSQVDKQVRALADEMKEATARLDLTVSLYELGQDAFVSPQLRLLCELTAS